MVITIENRLTLFGEMIVTWAK